VVESDDNASIEVDTITTSTRANTVIAGNRYAFARRNVKVAREDHFDDEQQNRRHPRDQAAETSRDAELPKDVFSACQRLHR